MDSSSDGAANVEKNGFSVLIRDRELCERGLANAKLDIDVRDKLRLIAAILEFL